MQLAFQNVVFRFFKNEVMFCKKINPLCLAGLIYYVCSKWIIFKIVFTSSVQVVPFSGVVNHSFLNANIL